jgi:hypothetical protein
MTELKVRRTMEETITLGENTSLIVLFVEGRINEVEINAGALHLPEVDPAFIERAADVLRQRRAENGDTRSVCALHGYFEWFRGGKTHSCPGCSENIPAGAPTPTLLPPPVTPPSLTALDDDRPF